MTDGVASLSASVTDTRLPPTLTPESSTDSSSEGHLNPRGSIRRKLSKQKGVEETETSPPSLPLVEESPLTPGEKEDSPSGMNSRSRQLVRGLALCGDDDTRLRPPPPAVQRHPNSLSRESSGTEYTDSSGVDLRTFVTATLHKNPRDRQMTLWLEQQLTNFVNDESAQSFKFPQMSSYNRMLIHRIAALFGLDHNVDNSGKAVVVNKTNKSARPDFDFSSLILSNQFSDTYRKNFRSVHSVDEAGIGRSLDNFWVPGRRTHSYESPHFGGQNTSPYMYQNGAGQSTEIHGHRERTAMLKKAGSFGGVPVYYRSASAHNTADRPVHFHDDSAPGSVGTPANIAELSDGITQMQLESTPRVQMSPLAVSPNMYNYGYQQPIYVNSPALSPSGYNLPSHQPYIVQTTVHQVAVPAAGQVPYAIPYYPNGFSDECMYQMSAGSTYYTQPSPVPVPYVIQPPYYETAEYATTEESEPPTTVQHPQSLDRGYGSLTNQDSLREETE